MRLLQPQNVQRLSQNGKWIYKLIPSDALLSENDVCIDDFQAVAENVL
jgi:hypothetical protein